jgi:riboflavin-specific deaminase-like protein
MKTPTKQRPFVLVNFAMTADGKVAFADHSFVPFGSKRDREHMMELRATADAVMSGARTINESGATMGTGGAKYCRLRLKRGLAEYNLRIIVSGSGSVNPGATIFKKRFSPVIILTTARISKTDLKKLQGVADEVKVCGKREVNFRTALAWLSKKWGVKRLLCEGGGELCDALFRAGLVDELHLTICPKIFGGRRSPTVADGVGFNHLANAALLELKQFECVGDEAFAVFQAQNTRK